MEKGKFCNECGEPLQEMIENQSVENSDNHQEANKKNLNMKIAAWVVSGVLLIGAFIYFNVLNSNVDYKELAEKNIISNPEIALEYAYQHYEETNDKVYMENFYILLAEIHQGQVSIDYYLKAKEYGNSKEYDVFIDRIYGDLIKENMDDHLVQTLNYLEKVSNLENISNDLIYDLLLRIQENNQLQLIENNALLLGYFPSKPSTLSTEFQHSEKYYFEFEDSEFQIYYTLDGSDPATNSQVYEAPILLEEDTEIRAIAINHKGLISKENAFNFIINIEPEIRIVSTITDTRKINNASVFLSNFSELNMDSFTITELDDYKRIQYALNHIYKNVVYSTVYNNYYTLERFSEGGQIRERLIIDSSRVDHISNRDLNRTIFNHQSIEGAEYHQGKYHVDVYEKDGSYSFVNVTNLSLREDGLYFLEGDEYIGYKSFFTRAIIETPLENIKSLFDDFKKVGKVTALAELDSNNRFRIIEYNHSEIEPVLISARDESRNYLISDAQSGQPIDSATLNFRQGTFNESGRIVYTTQTDRSGYYRISNLPSGSYTIEVLNAGYIDAFFNVTYDGRQITGQSNFSISRTLESDSWRIVLNWGENPRDLDSHLVGSGGNYHIYYANRSWDGQTVFLDRDDTSGFGPETITINDLTSGTYKYFVHDFTNRGRQNSYEMSNSNATVTVYRGDRMLERFEIEPNRVGTVWEVFEIKNGNIIATGNYRNVYDFHTNN